MISAVIPTGIRISSLLVSDPDPCSLAASAQAAKRPVRGLGMFPNKQKAGKMSDICPACNYQMYIQLPCLQLFFLIYPFKGSSPVPVRSVPANQGKNETGKQGNCNTIAVLWIASGGLFPVCYSSVIGPVISSKLRKNCLLFTCYSPVIYVSFPGGKTAASPFL